MSGQRLPRARAGRPLRAILALLLLASSAGCLAGYRWGNRTLYSCNVRTVYVPVFESDSLRRQLGERLTEAVIREIQTKTPYQIAGSQEADSILSGRITSDTKRVIVETPTDEPRQLDVNFQVQVSWIDRRTNKVEELGAVPLPPAVVDVGQSWTMIAEVGQSVASSQQQVIDRLAQQIVALMEQPW